MIIVAEIVEDKSTVCFGNPRHCENIIPERKGGTVERKIRESFFQDHKTKRKWWGKGDDNIHVIYN